MAENKIRKSYRQTKEARKKVRPSPALIAPGKWTVRDIPEPQDGGQPRVCMETREMDVPGAPTRRAWVLRMHEMGHVAYTPAGDKLTLLREFLPCDPDMKDVEIVGSFEDARVNYLLSTLPRQGYRYREGFREELNVCGDNAKILKLNPKKLERDKVAHALLLLVSSDFCVTYPSGIRGARVTTRSSKNSMARKYQKIHLLLQHLYKFPTFENAVKAGRIFRLLFWPDTPTRQELGMLEDDRPRSFSFKADSGSLADALRGVEFRIKRFPMPRNKRTSLGLSPKPQDLGVVPKDVHRYGWGPMFRQKVRAQGGTILLDTSGSMSLSSSDILRLLNEAPLARIALYSGDDDVGTLRIVADNGRMADEGDITRRFGGNNEVDIHSLEWLTKQPGPRLWVSDGLVTGRGDRHFPVLTSEANRLMDRGDICRADNIREALRIMNERKTSVRDGSGKAPYLKDTGDGRVTL